MPSLSLAAFIAVCILKSASGFNVASPSAKSFLMHHTQISSNVNKVKVNNLSLFKNNLEKTTEEESSSYLNDEENKNRSRRNFIATVASSAIIITSYVLPSAANAVTTSDAAITDKIYIEFKGLGGPSDPNDRIVIGLFGNDAPQPVLILKQIVTRDGYKSKCKPLDTTRVLQKEQLEANKVYNNCIENEDKVGVNYEYSTVWRVIAYERIDVGAVSGKFIARENPNFEDTNNGLKHDAAGVVSVRRGNDSGYGFTIYPGGGDADALDEDNIVVGRVIEGMDVVEKLNQVPVVKNALAGKKDKKAPSRACRYGGSELYCNEQKPLKKIQLDRTGVL